MKLAFVIELKASFATLEISLFDRSMVSITLKLKTLLLMLAQWLFHP